MSDQNIRQEMVANAVSFLTDPSVADTPLTKKIQFLEAKGMTNAEIQHAMTQSQGGSLPISASQNPTPTPPVPMSLPPGQMSQQIPPYQYYTPPTPPRSYDWKDYVIMGTTTAGFMYGAYQIISRYVLPKMVPPSQSRLDEDKDAMEREFQRVEAMLDKLQNDQTEFIQRQDEKSKLIDEALIEVDAIVKATNEKNLRNEETLKYLKLEIDSIKTTLLKNLDSQKLTITNELQELQKKTDGLRETVSHITTNKSDSASTLLLNMNKSVSPPPNLLTNNRSTSSLSTNSSVAQSYPPTLNIPPPSSIPSAKDILGSDFKATNSTPLKTAVSADSNVIDKSSSIPAWQLASSQKQNDSNATIPAWQLAAQSKD